MHNTSLQQGTSGPRRTAMADEEEGDSAWDPGQVLWQPVLLAGSDAGEQNGPCTLGVLTTKSRP